MEQLWPAYLDSVGDHTRLVEEDMTAALSLSHTESPMQRPPPAPRASRPGVMTTKAVEIIAPDRYCADLLLQDAGRLFTAEILSGSGCIVRLEPPAGGDWVLEVVSLVERWLDSVPLPCTKVYYGDRSYLIRASTGIARPVNAM